MEESQKERVEQKKSNGREFKKGELYGIESK